MNARHVLAIAAVLILVVAGAAQTERPAPEPVVKFVSLPESLKLPAVGNLAAVRQWQFGRIEGVVDQGNQLFINIRASDGRVFKVAGPGPELSEFARASNWLESPDKQRPGRADYVERMVAFDVDANQRLVAMISLEPMNRNNNRLGRAIGG